MHDKFVTIKEVMLKNNCPECFNKEGLKLTFKQRFIETKFHKSITDEIKHELTCHTCNTNIYPVQWTDDIERVFEYQKKAFAPKKASRYLKRPSWTIIASILVILLTIVILIVYPKL